MPYLTFFRRQERKTFMRIWRKIGQMYWLIIQGKSFLKLHWPRYQDLNWFWNNEKLLTSLSSETKQKIRQNMMLCIASCNYLVHIFEHFFCITKDLVRNFEQDNYTVTFYKLFTNVITGLSYFQLFYFIIQDSNLSRL